MEERKLPAFVVMWFPVVMFLGPLLLIAPHVLGESMSFAVKSIFLAAGAISLQFAIWFLLKRIVKLEAKQTSPKRSPESVL